ncbi:winged helix-turn-helix domain-containing protein [Bradyrhizobium sp. dw_411]|uniref:ATP-binding protein n=1 Tax=Bradyrhizobium sp. dw_411 TaxID=2720082 RepID=UPI001C49D41C|nr:winged helix-turn-helix domain-containing protein [Bradyrhizobium sp. dw_411]
MTTLVGLSKTSFRSSPSISLPRSPDCGKLSSLSKHFKDRDDLDIGTGIAFGPFRLLVTERLLEKAGVPVPLGSRALDILILLAERAGEVVSKRDLISRVWPDLTVDENSLRVHIVSLRKALGDGKAGARYVTNVTGRGYCFVAPITQAVKSKFPSIREAAGSEQPQTLPLRLSRMVGRDATVRTISERLEAQRFVTIHGPGGIGKTTVAVWVGHAQLAAFEGAVCFVDLGTLKNPSLVPSAVASALGLPVQSSDPTPDLIHFLRNRRMLLILDNCEHVIDIAATLAARIFQQAPRVAILATSREVLKVEGEHIYRLSALECPPEGIELTAAQILAFPAAHLFAERAAAGGFQFRLTDEDAAIVAEICRKLDGVALAIELAAGRVDTYGLLETAGLLDNRLSLFWHGQRTALSRHRTLATMVDWSHDLLTDVERTVLRRLSIFVGFFKLEAAQAVAADDLDATQIADAVGRLAAKSLISVDACGPTMRYRLLDATRNYAFAKLVDCGEEDAVARRHAVYCRAFLERADGDDNRRSIYMEHLGNVRAALQWSFDRGDVALGIALAAVATRLFLELSLLNECRRWTERALSMLNDAALGTQDEMKLQEALGLSLMFTIGNNKQAHAALSRGLELAEKFPDRINQFRLIGRLHLYHRRAGNLRLMLKFAMRAMAIAKQMADPVGIAAANSLVGVSRHLVGNQTDSRAHLEMALVRLPFSNRTKASDFGFYRERARIALARTLWLQGYPDQAVRIARQVVSEPATFEPVTLCIVLIWGFSVFRWTGDWASGEECVERLIPHAERHSLTAYRAVGFGLAGEMLIKRGEIEAGMDLLRGSMQTLHADQYTLYATEFNAALADGFAMTGRIDQALATIDQTIARVSRDGNFLMPELLRARGKLLEQTADERGAEACFLRSIELAGRQSALSWRLRASTDLARLRFSRGRCEEARKLLAETYACFNEGFHTVDLRAAKQTLEDMSQTIVG